MASVIVSDSVVPVAPSIVVGELLHVDVVVGLHDERLEDVVGELLVGPVRRQHLRATCRARPTAIPCPE